jgi:hypothetical protein
MVMDDHQLSRLTGSLERIADELASANNIMKIYLSADIRDIRDVLREIRDAFERRANR